MPAAADAAFTPDWIETVAAASDFPLGTFRTAAITAGRSGSVQGDLPGVMVCRPGLGSDRSARGFYWLSHRHGRSVVTWLDECGWVAIKGVGWISGPAPVLTSPKDPELVFGLFDIAAAKREMAVSTRLRELGVGCCQVLGFARLVDADLPPELKTITESRFRSGRRVEPALLYTQCQSPLRVTDLAYLNDGKRGEAVQRMCQAFGCESVDLVRAFMDSVGRTVGLYHRHGCVNDTLEASNITLLAEITDFEWFSVPGIPLVDGTEPGMLVERQQKEVLYAAEIGQELGALTGRPLPQREALRAFLAGYASQQPMPAVTEWAYALLD